MCKVRQAANNNSLVPRPLCQGGGAVNSDSVYSGHGSLIAISPVLVGVWGLAKEDWRGVTYRLIATRLGIERQALSHSNTITLTTQTPSSSPLTHHHPHHLNTITPTTHIPSSSPLTHHHPHHSHTITLTTHTPSSSPLTPSLSSSSPLTHHHPHHLTPSPSIPSQLTQQCKQRRGAHSQTASHISMLPW